MRMTKLISWMGLAALLLLAVGCSGARTDKPKADSEAVKAVSEGIPTGAVDQTQMPPPPPGGRGAAPGTASD